MKWISVYLGGYVLFMAGVFIALWHWGVLDNLGPTWTTVICLVTLGIGMMISVSASGRKETVEIDTK